MHQNLISMAEGVADPIDAMFHGFEGMEWEPIDVCHADRDDNVKRFPTMIAEYYMGGIAAGMTLPCSEQRLALHVGHAVLDLEGQDATPCAATLS